MRPTLLALLTFVLAGCTTMDTYPWPRSVEYMADGGILVFSQTKDWRHEEAIPAATLYLVKYAEAHGLAIHSTEDSRVFNEADLARFSVVVFNNASGNLLTSPQRVAFEAWLMEGGGFLGIHGAGDGSQADWDWYQNELIGALFTGHIMVPQFQEADLHVLAADHPVVEDLPATFRLQDEWYSFDQVPDDRFTLLLGLDEASYEQKAGGIWPDEDLVMGTTPAQHPIAWARCIGEGRSVYSALGHTAAAYEGEEHRQLLTNALDWVRKREQSC